MLGKKQNPKSVETILTGELCGCFAEYAARDYAVSLCANTIARLVAKCDFQVYERNRKVKDAEWHVWNVEPNQNQNSSEFLQKLICKAVTENEAIAVPIVRNGIQYLLVADSYVKTEYATKPNEYTDVVCGELTFKKIFREKDVIRIRYNSVDVGGIINALYATQGKLLESAQKAYERSNGIRMKVHVGTVAAGADDFQQKFAELMASNVKPFASSTNAVLPEFDGYDFEELKSGTTSNVSHIRDLFTDIISTTARAFGIPPKILLGETADNSDAMKQLLTTCIDPLVYQLEEEINRKRFTADEIKNGTYLHIDSSSIIHFDVFENAEKIVRLIESGAFSVNDVLLAIGMTALPDEWADRHWMTRNNSNVEDAAKSLEGGENA